MFFQELLYVRFGVVGFVPQLPITQHPRTAVALQGLLARLQELAQILIVQEAFAVHVHHLLDLLARKQGEHPLLAVKACDDFVHPSLESFGFENHRSSDLWVSK